MTEPRFPVMFTPSQLRQLQGAHRQGILTLSAEEKRQLDFIVETAEMPERDRWAAPVGVREGEGAR